jgi:hypothetical protein
MIPKSGRRFSEKIMRHEYACIAPLAETGVGAD